MEFSEAVRRRRMTRNFDGAALDRSVVDGLVAEALTAPSAGHTQGRELVVLEGHEQTDRYWQATTDADAHGGACWLHFRSHLGSKFGAGLAPLPEPYWLHFRSQVLYCPCDEPVPGDQARRLERGDRPRSRS